MKAAFYNGIENIQFKHVAALEIGPDEMLLKVKACAICGTDLRIYKHGHFKIAQGEQRVLGHEIAGQIDKVGENVKTFKVGQRVALPPNVGCGTCEMCLRGYNQLCPDYEAFGISYDGGFQEYMRIPADAIARGNVIEIPDTLSYEEAAMVEPFSCTYNSYKVQNTRPGDVVVIIGAGPIGACHVMMNKLAGAGTIIVADVSDARLNEIKQFGTDLTINSAQHNLVETVMKVTHNRGANIVITACSVPEIQQTALEIAAPHGKVNFFGGMPKGKEVVPLNTNLIHYKELIVVATTGSSLMDYKESMKIAASGKIPLAQLATARFLIDDINAAFSHALSGLGMKTMIVMEE